MEKTARQNKTKKYIIISYLLSLIFYLGCEQSAGSLAGAREEEGEPEWWETWEEPEEEELPPPEITGISVAKKPDTTLYALGEEFKGWDGLAVLWDWSDGHHEEVKEYTLSPNTMNTASSGPRRITVRAGEWETEFSLYVSASPFVLESISVKTAPTGLYLGEPFNTTGMVVEGTYTGSVTANIPLGAVSIEGYDSFKRADQTVTLRVNSRTVPLVVRPRVKPGASFYGNEYTYTSLKHQDNEIKPAYIKGMDFDLAGSNLKAKFFHSSSGFDLILTPGNGLYPEDIKGYDKNKAGKQMLTLSLDGVNAARTVPVYVLDAKPDVWFDYGFMRHGGDPAGAGAGFGKYHVVQGKPLVLAPVRYLIGYNDDHTPAPGTTYNWTVEGGSYDTAQPRNGEFFTFVPKAAGTYTVRVTVAGRNYVDGTTITKTATTEVVSFAPGTQGATKAWGTGNASSRVLRNFAPGQFVVSGTGYGWSLGAIGGYSVRTVDHKNSYPAPGNSFGWHEPGIAWLQEDNNGNGVPDEMWYELKGPSDLVPKYRPFITRRYANTWWDVDAGESSTVNEFGQTIRSICWADCKGRSGLLRGGFPRDWGVTGDWVTYTCTLIGDDGDISNGTHSTDACTFSSVYDEEKGHYTTYADADGTSFYTNDAIDAQGNPVTLSNVRFLKIHTAVFQYGGIFGEYSTEDGSLH
jgi:hypothetical protein